jgi:hypothetical protein
MLLLIIIILLVLVFGGGGYGYSRGYYAQRPHYGYGMGGLGVFLLVIQILNLLFGHHGYY